MPKPPRSATRRWRTLRRTTGRLGARRRAALAAALTTLAAAPLCGCGTSQPPPISTAELAGAKSFPYYTLYWVGESFAGQPLTAADGVEGYKPKDGDSIYYGDCVGGGSVLGAGGCRMPLKVSTAIYALHSNVDLGPQRNAVLRGVPAAIFDEGRAIELYAGRVTIDVYSDTPARALAAVRLLRPINAAGSSGAPLPPPVYCPWLAGGRPPAEQALLEHLPGGPCELFKAALAQTKALKRS